MARKEERYELNVFKLSKVTCKIEKEEKLEKGEIEGTGREVFGVGVCLWNQFRRWEKKCVGQG